MYQKNERFLLLITLVPLLLAFPSIAKCDIEILPESRHQQFQTYGLFFEQQSSLLFQNAGKAWGALATALPLFEAKDWRWKPQLGVNGSANAAFRINDKHDTLLTETVDARVGLSLDLSFSDEFRGMIMWQHQSGHISDNVPDKDLFGPNLGNEILFFRVLRDFGREWRLGGSLRPVLGSDPGMKRFGAEQFAEWFPWGASENPRHFSPFVAAGLEEYGRNAVDLTFHAQVGAVAGSHFTERRHPTLRLVLGYYNGVDPRLKYLQFLNRKAEFAYAGLMFDI